MDKYFKQFGNRAAWEQLHRVGLKPWDLESTSPPLQFFFTKEESEGVKREVAIIPGCGQVKQGEMVIKYLTVDLGEWC